MRVLKPFEYLEPGSVKETVAVLATSGGKAKLLAGGLDLIPRLRKDEVKPEYIVCIQRIPGLDYIKEGSPQVLNIGALTSIRSIELSPIVQESYIVLSEAAHNIASVQVKIMGTAVGNLCVATPASDIAAALFALNASLRITSTKAERVISIEDFFLGVNRTVLEPGEMVTEILVPEPLANSGGAFLKLVRVAADVAKVNVAVMLTIADGKCLDSRIALGAVAPTIIRAKQAEDVLKSQRLTPEMVSAAAESAAAGIKPITDIRSTAEYRKQVTAVLVRRAIEKAIARAKS